MGDDPPVIGRTEVWQMLSEKAVVAEQIQFARHNFDNHQALIRFADTKAAAALTLVVFLCGITIPVARDAVPKIRWPVGGGGISSCLYLLSYLALFGTLGVTLLLIDRVIRPRQASHYSQKEKEHGILYYEHVLAHETNKKFYDSVQNATPEQILRNICDQVFELASIFKRKMDALQKLRGIVLFSLLSWFANTGLGLWIGGWK
jgi:hypothetical protein